ncbi:MAG: hypothetical protein AAB262_02415, partial [Elusimicrobiota bacterium]
VYTLSNPVGQTQVYLVFTTSVTVNWSPVPSTAAIGYVLQASTAPDFTGTVRSSTTLSVSLSTLTVSNLLGDTTYYLRVGSLNGDAVANYAPSVSTMTLPLPAWLSPADNAGYSLNRRPKVWFLTRRGGTKTDAIISVSTSTGFEVAVSTTFQYSLDATGWTGLPAAPGATVYFTPAMDLAAATTTLYLRARVNDGAWTDWSLNRRVLLRGNWAWTDDPITAGTTLVRATHVDELRTAVSNVLLFRGFSAPSWSDPALTPDATLIRAAHVGELRSQLAPALTAVGEPVAWTDDPLTPGVTTVRAGHVTELRTKAAVP